MEVCKKDDNKDRTLLESLNSLGVHDHLCLIYSTPEEQMAAAMPFMKIGLDRGEKCIYIADDNSISAVLDAFKAEGVDTDSALKSGALSVITKKEAYLRGGYFDPDGMIRLLKEACTASEGEGYAALRVTGEMTWALEGVKGSERLMEYESKLNYFFPENNVLAICQYNRNRFPIDAIRKVIQTHPLVIYGNTVCKNLYYVPPDEFLKPEQPSLEVERLLQNIVERERTDSILRRSESFLSEAQRIAHIGNWEWDIKADELRWSDEIYRIFGLGPREFEATYGAFLNFVHPEDRETVINSVNDALYKGKPYSIDHRIVLPEGAVRYVHEQAVVRYDREGKAERMSGVVMDITERKISDKKIQAQMQRLKALRAIDLAISGSFDLRVSANVILEQTLAQLRVDAADILILNLQSMLFECAAFRGFGTEKIGAVSVPFGKDLAGKVALKRKPHVLPDIKDEPQRSTRASIVREEGFISYIGVPIIAKGHLRGVLEVFSRTRLEPDKDFMDLLEAFAGQTAIAVDNAEMFSELQSANYELMMAYDATIEGWGRALDYRDKETEGHSQRVTEMTVHVARAMGIDEEQLVHIRRGALLHDIGKLGVPDAILHKPDRLSVDEWVVMKRHPEIAHELLSPTEYLKPALEIPLHHHELWDGSGYPRGLNGEQIPHAARIFTVVDVWDALNSDRPYRPAWSKDRIIGHIKAHSGVEFDPKVVDVFLGMDWERLV